MLLKVMKPKKTRLGEKGGCGRSPYRPSSGLMSSLQWLHVIQWLYGCELWEDGRKGGFHQYGYDGRTFLTFDKETLTWVAPDLQAQITRRKWNALPGWNQRKKSYLEEICIEWLGKYLSYGKEILLRTETPKVTVSSRTEVEDGMETHICRVDGFYPREIDASWTRDGEVWLQDTLHGFVAPNSDGTYHFWLSIRIDPKERSRYRCHVEHDGLQEPLDLELKEPTSSKSILGLIIGCVVAALVLACAIAGVLVFFKSDKGYSSSGWGKSEGSCPFAKLWVNREMIFKASLIHALYVPSVPGSGEIIREFRDSLV
ncbi:PREDICTED: major histocompatibility complex class I-related gene protein-like [Thamnophis sirtalis]|uniref:Major histocompatibility complex class I-related gene protein-like n=1 Tax=Thamnophis sirtalis TaxID=35019 RepID=A0A6I9XYH5_9SAUR|nr:PREDICTED: major histocompatibility complex class I-related gene protein-like [Thamnophis sirtalis]